MSLVFVERILPDDEALKIVCTVWWLKIQIIFCLPAFHSLLKFCFPSVSRAEEPQGELLSLIPGS